ncbi:hypothetical protein SLEP1_g17504 [Rubroshorea leprosula]|uniref:Aminotransferase-like plant mobile domain-containing protein n=1 Tax=Rubroshorea leprosula TaxID=152421 RepID=A0AAV5J0C4_9ROSI|nr:hypothetical protein SLEP1_g17504 [Rubroshorea leprosula]
MPVPIHFAFSSDKTKDWSGWAKEILIDNGIVEILHAAEVFKLVALSQTLQINGNVECLRCLVRRWCTSTHTFILAFGEVTMTLEDKVMRTIANASSRSWRGEYNIDFPTWMRYFWTGEGENTAYVRVAFLTTWLSKFVFGGFPNHVIMAECIPLAIRLAEGVRFPLAPLMLGKRKIKRQIVPNVDGFLDDYGNFNFHAYKVMLGTFTPPEFGYDHDIPSAPSSDKTNWNKSMRPYINEAASNMWSEGVATLRFFSTTKMSTMSPLMLEYWATLLKREDDGQWVPICLPILGLVEEEYSATKREPRQEATDDAGIRVLQKYFCTVLMTIAKEADEAAPLRKSAMGKRKSIAQPPKSKARRTSASLANKQSKAKAPTPSKTRTTKGRGAVDGTSSEGFGPVSIPGDDEIPSKSKEAKRVETLAVNMEETLANPDVRQKILVREIGEPPLPGEILNFVDSIIDWSDPTSFTIESMKKAKANETKGGVRVSYGTSSMTKKPGATKTQLETSISKPHPISELPPFRAGVEKGKVTEVISFDSSDDSSEGSSTSDASSGSKVVANKPSGSLEKKITNTIEMKCSDQPSPTPAKPSGAVDRLSPSPIKSSEANDFAVRLLKNLEEMNEDRDMSLAQFGLAVNVTPLI